MNYKFIIKKINNSNDYLIVITIITNNKIKKKNKE